MHFNHCILRRHGHQRVGFFLGWRNIRGATEPQEGTPMTEQHTIGLVIGIAAWQTVLFLSRKMNRGSLFGLWAPLLIGLVAGLLAGVLT